MPDFEEFFGKDAELIAMCMEAESYWQEMRPLVNGLGFENAVLLTVPENRRTWFLSFFAQQWLFGVVTQTPDNSAPKSIFIDFNFYRRIKANFPSIPQL